MSAQQATQTATAPASAAVVESTQAAPGAVSEPVVTTTKDTKPAAPVMGATDDVVDASKAGEPGTQGGESKDGKPAVASELEIKLPEGFKADEAMLKDFKEFATKQGLSSPQASEAAAWYIQKQAQQAEVQSKAWEQQDADWAKQLREDKEFGGDKLNTNILKVRNLIKRYGGEQSSAGQNEVTELLTNSGLSNHPALFKLLARVAAASAEDSSAAGRTPNAGAKDPHTKDRAIYHTHFNEDGTLKK